MQHCAISTCGRVGAIPDSHSGFSGKFGKAITPHTFPKRGPARPSPGLTFAVTGFDIHLIDVVVWQS